MKEKKTFQISHKELRKYCECFRTTQLLHVLFYFALIKGRSIMTQYNTLNVKFSNQKINKLKSGTKNGTEVTLKIFSSVFGDSNDENIFLQKLLLTNTQVSKLCKVSANNSSTNTELSGKLNYTKQENLENVLGPLLKTGLYLNHQLNAL